MSFKVSKWRSALTQRLSILAKQQQQFDWKPELIKKFQDSKSFRWIEFAFKPGFSNEFKWSLAFNALSLIAALE